MSSKKRKNKKKKKRFDLNVCNLDYNRLSESIVKADKIKSKENQEYILKIKEKRRQSWDKILNQKTVPKDARWTKKICISSSNIFYAIKNMTFMKKEDILDGNVTYGLFAFLTNLLFLAAAIILYIFSIIWLISGTIVIIETFAILNFFDFLNLLLKCISVISSSAFIFFIGSICKVAAMEIEKIDDAEKIISIFNVVLTFVGIIVAIIGIFVTTKQF